MFKSPKNIYLIEDFLIDTHRRQMFHANKLVPISSRAFEILVCLIVRNGEVVEKNEIIEMVWSDSFVEEGNLAVHISALRRALNETRGESRFIKTISGRGYSFIAPVKILDEEQRSFLPPKKETKRAVANANSIAVLPFTFDLNKPELNYLANGLTGSLIDELAQIRGLRVIAHRAVQNYKDENRDFQEIGFLLGVSIVIVGHLSEHNAKLVVDLELVDPFEIRHIWGSQYVNKQSDFLELKRDVSNIIREKLALTPTLGDLSEPNICESKDSESYREYLKGKYILETISTRKNLKKDLNQALKFFRKAIEKNPESAVAYTSIGDSYVHLYNNNLIDKTTAYIETERALQKATKLRKDFSEALVLQGTVAIIFEGNLKKAESFLKQSVKQNPNNPEGYHWLGFISICFGKFDQALELQNIAVRLDPTSLPYNNSLIRVFYFSRQYEKAILQAEEILEIDSRSVPAHLIIALSLSELGRFDQAAERIKRAIQLRASSDILLLEAYISASRGNIGKTRKSFFDILQKTIPDDLDHTTVAIVYSALNQNDKAFFHLEMALQMKQPEILHIKVDPRLKNLRNDPRYPQLLKKLGLRKTQID